jgi:hypothetical protein
MAQPAGLKSPAQAANYCFSLAGFAGSTSITPGRTRSSMRRAWASSADTTGSPDSTTSNFCWLYSTLWLRNSATAHPEPYGHGRRIYLPRVYARLIGSSCDRSHLNRCQPHYLYAPVCIAHIILSIQQVVDRLRPRQSS